jgi:hypothetical protein
LFITALGLYPAIAAPPLDSALDARVQDQKAASAAQDRIDNLANDTQAMLQEYRQLTGQAKDLKAYNDHLERLVNSQKQELASFSAQLENVQEAQVKIVPLIRRMVDVLDELIALDTPFLAEERKNRLESLKAMLDRADVALPEKYRRVMEAYQIEADYGRTLEASNGPLVVGKQNRTVNFLRVGRMMLLYASMDGAETGYWDKAARAWKVLPSEYNHAIAEGLRVARKEAPPDLITLPISAPETAQ